MEQPILKTQRCILRPSTTEDAKWLFELFNDVDVISYIEGIRWFNTDLESVIGFINLMEVNSPKNSGFLWSIIFNDTPIGFIMVNDLNEEPFYTFALLPLYRGLELMKECIIEINRYLLIFYHQTPVIVSTESNLSALKLMKKINIVTSQNHTV